MVSPANNWRNERKFGLAVERLGGSMELDSRPRE